MSTPSRTTPKQLCIAIVMANAALAGQAIAAEETTVNDKVVISGKALQPWMETPEGYIATEGGLSTKLDTPLVETPQAVSVVTSDFLDRIAPQSLEEAVRYVPGASARFGAGTDPRFDWMQMRGFAGTYDMIYLDGLKQINGEFAIPKQETYGAESIEVSRGPAGALYGSGSPGGIIGINSKRPTDDEHRKIRVMAGEFNQRMVAGDFAGTLSEEDNLSYRLVGKYYDRDMYADFTELKNYYFAPSVKWQLSDKTEITFLSQISKKEVDGSSFQSGAGRKLNYQNLVSTVPASLKPQIDAVPDTIYIGDPDSEYFHSDYITLGYQLKHQFNDSLTLNQSARLSKMELEYRYSVPSGFDLAAGLPALFYTSLISPRMIDEDVIGLSIDTNLLAEWDQGDIRHKTLMGLDTRISKRDYLEKAAANFSLNLLDPDYDAIPDPVYSTDRSDDQVDDSLIGLYVQDQAYIGDHWIVNVGGRYDLYDQDADNKLTSTTESQDANEFSGRAAVMYSFDNGFAPYLSYTETFTPNSGRDGSTNELFKPSTSNQWELGLKFQSDNQKQALAVAVYDLVQQNPVIFNGDTNQNIQEGEITSQGFEVEYTHAFENGVNLVANYAKTDAELTESETASRIGRTVDNVPEYTAGVWVDYALKGDLNGWLIGGGIRRIGPSVNYASIPGTLPETKVDIDAYTVADAVIGYQINDLKLSMNINNLTDNRNTTSCSAIDCKIDAGRIVTLQADYNF